MLTWGLWNQGNGTYTLHAYAFDQEDNLATIGKKTVIVSNDTATKHLRQFFDSSTRDAENGFLSATELLTNGLMA